MKPLIDHPLFVVEERAKDLLLVRLRGDGHDSAVEEGFALVQPLLRERAPVRVIIDARRISDIAMSARWKIAMHMKHNRPFIRRSYIFGLSDTMRFAARVVIRASGRQNVELVDSEAQAVARAGESVRPLHLD